MTDINFIDKMQILDIPELNNKIKTNIKYY